MEERVYGKTGEKFPILSFGAMNIVDGEGCSEKEAIKMVNYALDRGIRYFDTAWWYWEGESEERLGKVAKHRRKEMWIATKTLERTRRESREQLEESLRRLQTDYIDEWRMHYVWSFDELDRITAPGGALETAVKAREEGKIRFISMSNHGNPAVQIKALELFPFDSVLFPASVLDRFVLSFVDELLPVIKTKGIASAGMKIVAIGKLATVYDKALRYAFSQPIDTAVVGMSSMAQLKKDLAIAENYRPLDETEKLALFKKVLPKVTPQNMPWKAEDWDNPVEWLKR
ncbi:MAG: aldo/keto reductase [Dehalococcoidales bacterium]|nr:aldo/keto reductase [Dehalococcoidales bacterium]